MTLGYGSVTVSLARSGGAARTRDSSQTTTNIHPQFRRLLTRITHCALYSVSSFANHFLSLLISTIFQDGWWGLEHEKVVAPAPDEKSGASVAGREEGGTL